MKLATTLDLLLVPYGRPAMLALREAVAAAKAGQPLAPVSVAVPSNYAGLSLRRLLGQDGLQVLEERPGLVNVRFLVLARVAELLGSGLLAGQGRRPLAPPLRAEAVRAVLADKPGPFLLVRDHPATERSLEAVFRDLRQASDEALNRLGSQSDRAAHVVLLFRAFRQRTAHYYDEDDLAMAAAQAARDGSPALRDLGRVVLYLPRKLSPSQRELVAALAEQRRIAAVIGLTGELAVDEPARALGDDLARSTGADRGPRTVDRGPGTMDRIKGPRPTVHGPTAEPSIAAQTRIVIAPDAEEEARIVLRMAMQRHASGTPLYRMAVLYPSPQPYALLLHQVFSGAGVPNHGPSVKTLAQTLAGRMLLGLLRLAEADFRREVVMDWLTSAPVLERPGRDPAPAQRWDVLSRSAGVVRGLYQWRDRLKRYADAAQAQRKAIETTDEEATDWRLARLAADQQQAERLGVFIEEVASQLDPSRRETWRDFVDWAHGLLGRYLGGEGHRRDWPESEIEAAQAVERAVEGLLALDAVRQRTDESTFRRALERELEAPAGRAGRFGEGLFVGRIADALGADFDVVFVVGMAEGLYPPVSRDDPLVSDHERQAAGEDIPLRASHPAEVRRDYLAALSAAPERVLVYPRADVRGQRGKLPSRWLLETASELERRAIYSSDLEALSGRHWLTRLASFQAALAGEGERGSEQEYDLASLLAWHTSSRQATAHYLCAEQPALSRGLEASLARRDNRFTRWDGRTDSLGPLPVGTEHSVSPTSLQNWAECPFRHFLGYMLRVAETEKPEELLTISPLERGSLIHEALEAFIREASPRTLPSQPWTAAERARLLEVGERLCDRYQAEGRTGKRLLWSLAREGIRNDLTGVLDADEQLRSDLQVVPQAVELAFGVDDNAAPAGVELADGRTIGFRGRVDRLDRSPDGSRLVVLDYKTGSVWGDYKQLTSDPVARGRLLQLPIYAVAAQQRYGASSVAAYYWFVTDRAGYARHGYPVEEPVLDRFRQVLEIVLDGIGAGLFPARPGAATRGGFENCTFCPYDACCARDRDRAWQRKRSEPELERYRRLAEE